jgi:hypothetical protein
MIASIAPVSSTIAGTLIVYVMCPLMVIFIVAAVTAYVRWVRGVNARFGDVNERMATQDDALATLVNEVRPPGQPSLKDLMVKLTTSVAVLKDRSDRAVRGGR